MTEEEKNILERAGEILVKKLSPIERVEWASELLNLLLLSTIPGPPAPASEPASEPAPEPASEPAPEPASEPAPAIPAPAIPAPAIPAPAIPGPNIFKPDPSGLLKVGDGGDKKEQDSEQVSKGFFKTLLKL